MTCPKCNQKMKVVDTNTYETECVRKYRCSNCGGIMYTTELPCCRTHFLRITNYYERRKRNANKEN